MTGARETVVRLTGAGTVLALACGIALTLLGVAPARSAPAGPKERPNLLLITLDTTRADHMGSYGSKAGATPSLDAFARRSVQFSEAHAHVPLTLPSHANLLTGRLPSTLNLRVNGLRLKARTPGLPALLKKRGYFTAAVVSSVILDRSRGLAENFDVYDDAMTLQPRGGGPPEERRAEEVTRAALEAIKGAKGPFFLWAHYYDPHYDYRPPAPFAGRFGKSPYDGEIAYMDSQIGALLDGIERRRLTENTLVVVAGDHGEGLMEFGEKQHGVFLYEPMIHVPLWMSWKGHLPSDIKVSGVCGLVDVAPTICALMGLDPSGMDGVSLLPGLKGRLPERPQYIESYHGYFTYGWAPLRGILTGSLKLIEAPQMELYEWRRSEKVNLMASRASEARDLRSLLRRYPEADKGERAQMENLLKDPSNAETLRQLMSLGYLSGKGQRPDQKGLLDPKDAIDIEEALHKGQELLDMGKAEEGIAQLLAILKRNPANVPALSILGNAYLAQKQLDKARVCFEEEIRLKPQMDTAHLHLGTVHKRQGKPDLAAKEYRAALALNPRFPEAAANLASIYLEQKKTGEALAVIDEAMKNGAESADLYFELGVAKATLSDWERARWAFTKCISLDPTRHEAMANLGRIAFQAGRVDEAIANYERAIRLDSRNTGYLATLGSLYLTGKDDSEKALQYFNRALASQPYGPEAGRLREMIREIQAEKNAR